MKTLITLISEQVLTPQDYVCFKTDVVEYLGKRLVEESDWVTIIGVNTKLEEADKKAIVKIAKSVTDTDVIPLFLESEQFEEIDSEYITAKL